MWRSVELAFISILLLSSLTLSQTAPLTPSDVIEKVSPAVAVVLTGESPAAADGIGSAFVVRENGILLTAYHVVKDAKAVQVRFKNGEIFDDVQLLGVDARRDVAALRIAATGLPTLPVASASKVKTGDSIFLVSNPAGLPWTAASGIISAYRMADEIPGAGSGYRLLQFSAPASGGSSGGVVVDAQARVLALVVGGVTGENLNFGVPVENVLGLTEAPVRFTYASGNALQLPGATAQPVKPVSAEPVAAPSLPTEKTRVAADTVAPKGELSEDLIHSEILKSKDPDYILRNFRTMYVDARNAQFFDSARMAAALGGHDGFNALRVVLVNDRALADVVLEVSYTFAWDYPFLLRHQVTSIVLVSGKGYGPFSGPVGAESVAGRLIDKLKPYRVPVPAPKASKPKTGE